jgi:hypothetical protein
MRFYMQFRYLLILILIGVLQTSNVYSQALVKKNILIEEFTSATCKPCKLAGPILARAVQPLKDVYSIRYHVKFPPADDPLYLENITGINDRAAFYNMLSTNNIVSGIPNVKINGLKSVNPTNEPRLNDSIIADRLDSLTPVFLNVVQEKESDSIKVTVRVRTSQTLPTTTRLYIAIVNRRVYLPKLPFTLQGSNDKDDFEDAFMLMLPDGGIPLTLTNNVEQTFVYRYKPKQNVFWPNDMSYPVAFVQDSATRKVYQAGTDYKETKTELSIIDSKYSKLPSNSSITRKFSVKNPNTEALEVKLVLDTAGTPMPKGWNFDVTPESQVINAGESKEYTVTIQSTNDTAYFQQIRVFAYGSSEKIDIPSGEYFYTLSNNAKYILYTIGDRSLDTILMNDIKGSQRYHKETIAMAYVDSLLQNYPTKDFDVSIFALHGGTILKQENRNGIPLASIGNNTPNFINTIVDAYNNNKKVLLIAPRASWWALHDTAAALDGKVTLARNFLMNTMGISYVASPRRTTNNFPDTFSVRGVSQSQYFSDINSRINTSPSFITTFTDILALTPGSKSQAFMYSDNKQSNVVGVGMTDNAAKIFMFTVSPDAWVQNRNDRKLFVNRAIDWLLSANPSPNSVLSIPSPLSLNLGDRQIGQPYDYEITISSTPNSNYTVNSISNRTSAFVLDNAFLSTLPATISASSFNLKGVFTPIEQKLYRDTVTIFSNALNAEFSFIVSGNGVPPTSVIDNGNSVTASKIVFNGTNELQITASIDLANAELIDVNGQILFSASLKGLQEVITLPANLSSGTYFLKVTFENGKNQIHKVVILK